MNDFVAYPSRWRIALLVIGSSTFVAAGLWMGGIFGTAPESRRYSPEFIFGVGWLSVIFFGFCSMMWFRKLFDTREELRIGLVGIFSRSWSEKTIPWVEIADVTTWSYKRQKSIIIHLRNPHLFPGRGLMGMLQRANRKIAGGDIAISLTGTDRGFEEAMNAIAYHRPNGEQQLFAQRKRFGSRVP